MATNDRSGACPHTGHLQTYNDGSFWCLNCDRLIEPDPVCARVYAIARCVSCKAEQEVEVDMGQPFCDKCGSPMVAVEARRG